MNVAATLRGLAHSLQICPQAVPESTGNRRSDFSVIGRGCCEGRGRPSVTTIYRVCPVARHDLCRMALPPSITRLLARRALSSRFNWVREHAWFFAMLWIVQRLTFHRLLQHGTTTVTHDSPGVCRESGRSPLDAYVQPSAWPKIRGSQWCVLRFRPPECV